jgi:hypothetical protein
VARLTHAGTELRLELTEMLLGTPHKAAPSITNAGLESTTLLQMCASIASRSGGGGGRPAPVMGITARSARDFRDMVQSFRSRGPRYVVEEIVLADNLTSKQAYKLE